MNIDIGDSFNLIQDSENKNMLAIFDTLGNFYEIDILAGFYTSYI